MNDERNQEIARSQSDHATENNGTSTKNSLDRRRFLSLGAAGITAVTTAAFGGTAFAQAEQSGPSKGSTHANIIAKPLPPKVYNTEKAGISRKTHDEHYKLYQSVVKKVNEIREKLGAMPAPDPAKSSAIYSDIRELKVEYSFALGGVKNHELYFNHIGGTGGEPTGDIADLIKQAFGSFAGWKADLKATGIAARGWVWLAHDYTDNSLFNYIGDSQNTYPTWNATPLLGLDVYEHAYYLDFGTARAKYIDAFFEVIDWDAVNANLKLAVAVYGAANANGAQKGA